MNVDPQEINKFNTLASDWWDPEGPFKSLHDLNPLRLAFIQTGCTLANQRILDVGCGGGILTEVLANFSQMVIGLDMADAVLQVAQEHAKVTGKNIQYVQSSVEDYAKQYPSHFDVITCMEMIEHVPDPASTLQSLAALLKPEGHLFISTLNRTPSAFFKAIIGAEYILNMIPKGTHEYNRFIKPSELTTEAKKWNLHLRHMKGITYRLFAKKFSLSNDVSVNYLMHLQKG